MFDDVLLNDFTRTSLNAVADHPPQSIVLVGPSGIGKMTVATAVAQHLAGHAMRVQIVSPDDKATIAIEIIRDLYKTSRVRQDGRQVVIIERADRMSTEAQNAFLKLLEEPRKGLFFILTCLQLESLLPTIQSRAQLITMQPLPDSVIRHMLVSRRPGIAQEDLSQLLFLAQGRPGIALQLLTQDALPAQRERMQIVKKLISGSLYERYTLTATLAASRETALETLGAMARVVEAQLSSTPSAAQAKHWADLGNALEDALTAITHNGNVRAQLLNLFSRY